jgi:putative hemolysin
MDYTSFSRTHYPRAFARHIAGCANGARQCSQQELVARLGGKWHAVSSVVVGPSPAAAPPTPTTTQHDAASHNTANHAQVLCQGPGNAVFVKSTSSHRCAECKGPGDEVLVKSKSRHRSIEARLLMRDRGKLHSPVAESWPEMAWERRLRRLNRFERIQS